MRVLKQICLTGKGSEGKGTHIPGGRKGQDRRRINLVDKVECVCLCLSVLLLIYAPLCSRKVLKVTSLWVCACDPIAMQRAWHIKSFNKYCWMLSVWALVSFSFLLPLQICLPALSFPGSHGLKLPPCQADGFPDTRKLLRHNDFERKPNEWKYGRAQSGCLGPEEWDSIYSEAGLTGRIKETEL